MVEETSKGVEMKTELEEMLKNFVQKVQWNYSLS